MIKNFFNMIEVTLAIAVVGIGIAGIMSLFPVALNSSKNAVANNYSSLIADQFITFITMKANQSTAAWNSTSGISLDGTTFIQSTKSTTDDSTKTEGDWTPVATGSNIKYSSLGTDTIYKITQGSSSVTDFSGVVRIWQAPVNDMYVAGFTAGGTLGRDFANRVFIEVSWPSNVVYTNRQKRCYMIELFNSTKQANF